MQKEKIDCCLWYCQFRKKFLSAIQSGKFEYEAFIVDVASSSIRLFSIITTVILVVLVNRITSNKEQRDQEMPEQIQHLDNRLLSKPLFQYLEVCRKGAIPFVTK